MLHVARYSALAATSHHPHVRFLGEGYPQEEQVLFWM